jgi:hypothetical protein
MPKRSARIQNKTLQTTPPAQTGNNKITKPTKGKVIMVENPVQQTSKFVLDKGKENQFENQGSGSSTKSTDNTSPPLSNSQHEAAPHILKDKDEGSSPDIAMEDETNQEQAPLIVPITRQTEHMAVVPFDKIKGKTAKEKTKNLDKLFASFLSYSGTHIRVNKKVKYLVVNFTNEADLHKVLQQEITVSDTEKICCIKWDEIKPPTPEEEKHEVNDRTIQVIDIPLDVNATLVRSIFVRYGNITKLTMRTRNLYQHAFITYESCENIQHFKGDVWVDFIIKDCVRVLPLTLTAEQREIRQKYCFKLAGLPTNCRAKNIVDFLKDINARSIFIPRNPNNYKQLNYAYINFGSDEDLAAAAKTEYSYEGNVLYWCADDAKTCHICGNPDHMAAACSNKKQRSAKDDKLQKLYTKFRPAQHRKIPKSYAEAARRPQQQQQSQQSCHEQQQFARRQQQQPMRPWNDSHLGNKGTAHGGSMHEPNNNHVSAEHIKMLKKLQCLFEELKKDFAIQAEVISNFDKKLSIRNNYLKTLTKNKTALIENQDSSASASNSMVTANNQKRTHTDVEYSSSDEIDREEIKKAKEASDWIKKKGEPTLNSISAQLSSLVHHFLSGGGPSENDEIVIDEEENEQMEGEVTSVY